MKAKPKGIKKICPQGHVFYKSSACPVCPICEKQEKPVADFLSFISAPARRALEGAGLISLEKLSKLKEADILKLHGMGPASLPILRKALATKGLTFKK